MSRRRRGLPVSGWLNVDKPLGMSSAHVVAVARRVLNAAKVGHGGTLDPFASGVLPLAFGEATKTVPWVMDGEKTYAFRVRWGEARDTDDQEGVVVATSPVRPDRAAIESVLSRFVGDIVQVPPAYSAVKVDGRRAYDLARADVEVTLKPRTVRVHAFELVECDSPDEAGFHVVAGKGTYVRSLARDLAAALGTCGYVSSLRRLSCGPFRAEDAIPLEILRTLEQDTAALRLLPVEAALDDIPVVPLTEEEARRLSQGQALSLISIQDRSGGEPFSEGETVQALLDGRIVALAQVSRGALRSLRGFVS